MNTYLLTMFDLPSKTKRERRIYRRFRKTLLELGYVKIQFSVYLKVVENGEQAKTTKKCILKALPKQGNVRILVLPSNIYEKMETYNNYSQKENELPTPSFLVF